MTRHADPSPQPTLSHSNREYILQMLKDLAVMARKSNEHELAIQLTAIREAARVSKRGPSY